MISLIVGKLSLWNLACMNLVSSYNDWTNIEAAKIIFIFNQNMWLFLSLLRFRYMKWYKHITMWTHLLSITNRKTFKMWLTHPCKISSNPRRLSQNWPSWAFRPLKSTKFENPFWKVARSPYSRNGFTDHCQTWQGDAYCHL